LSNDSFDGRIFFLWLSEELLIEQIGVTETPLTIMVVSSQPQARCLLCQQRADHMHSW
jgi:hypothetical protein